MRKYQFCIRFSAVDKNSAASKAVLDCNVIFASHQYTDYTFTVADNQNKLTYYLHLFKGLLMFFLRIKRHSLIGIQYPLLSINNVFHYFIKLARFKGAKFFCVIHDLESLRSGGKDQGLIDREIKNLNAYDTIITHNDSMSKWLAGNQLSVPSVALGLFDYLTESPVATLVNTSPYRTIVFAGNLGKSKFIYNLPKIHGWNFNVYGPNFKASPATSAAALNWSGEFSPDAIAGALKGDFGLIWDGNAIEKCDEVLGNYLRYNNPHKCSLYIAAGLPVIAPADSAIGKLITEFNIGVLLNDLRELASLEITESKYQEMKRNVNRLSSSVISGSFFSKAITQIEQAYEN